ncbi:anhydro-N-acetylmuramic acid kinase [Paenibacillus sp. UNCCL117]|uniref:anhydro-N-acetylmuramic acid kinase n=1 Tax=unclassified Paenibacillus TaxID=185978 RepID=UPI00088E155C|nr:MULTISPECIES: anhydro-N-acetylmuramic acid kinase [unclassified Paenibacillus]SDD39688.1 anhydro-N-acetylmuramic acid kinase [Paenibacillus sp. cl123]SFW48306.1 anhydro-N-acetylmuramic acid kinase [Paenibacillus sp. UNCCL117]
MIGWLRDVLEKEDRLVVGLMSGTSLDGIDAAVVRIAGSGLASRAELVHFHSVPYTDELRERLKRLCSPDSSSVPDICAMNFYIAERFAEAAGAAAAGAGLTLDDIDLISSHGQTIWHIPVAADPTADPFGVRSTLQIGDLSVIAKLTGRPVAGDFRTADMAVGGQGAPLTPYGDLILFRDERIGRIVQNIGGIGNCAVLPCAAKPYEVSAFDTGPGNMLIDQAVWELSGGRMSYDADGAWGAAGQPHEALLEEMMSHPYFALQPVKTTGREMFGKAYAEQWLSSMRGAGLPAEDIVATFTAFTARSIAQSYTDFVLPRHAVGEVVISGGGAHNRTLLRMLAELLPQQQVRTAASLGVSDDAKEAICFAIFGNNLLHGEPNNLPSATGASRETVMGKLALP